MDTNMDTLIYNITLNVHEEKVYKGIYFFRGAEGQENIQFLFLAEIGKYTEAQMKSTAD